MSSPNKTQSHISSYFTQSTTDIRKRQSSPIDLTGDVSDDAPSSSKRPRLGHPTSVLNGDEAKQKRKEDEELRRKRLFRSNNPFLQRKSSSSSITPTITPATPRATSITSVSDHSQSDDELCGLLQKFSHKPRTPVSKKAAPSSNYVRPKKTTAPTGPSGEPYTPLEMQVLQLQREHPGTLLMIESGYKYRFFGDDAKVAQKELGMCAYQDRNFLVASVPVHRRDIHLRKLLSQGYRVGIVMQSETAALKKAGDTRNKVFKRQLAHLYTASTYVDDLDSVDDVEKYNPPPCLCLVEEQKDLHNDGDVHFSMMSICPATGDVIWDDFDDSPMRLELETRLAHIKPSELLLLETGLSKPTEKMLAHYAQFSPAGKTMRIERFKDDLSPDDAFQAVEDFYTKRTERSVALGSESFRSGTLIATIADFPPRVVVALAQVITYLSKFDIADALFETKFFKQFSSQANMLLAANTLSNLEVYLNETTFTSEGSLLKVLDKTTTKFGARLLRSWVGKPLVDKTALQERVDAVQEIIESPSDVLSSLYPTLRNLPDLAKGISRIQYGRCTPKELCTLLTAFKRIGNAFDPFESPENVGFNSPLLNEIVASLPAVKIPTAEIAAQIFLDHAAAGEKAKMFRDEEKYSTLTDNLLALQALDADFAEELKRIRKLLRFPSLQWTTIMVDEYLIQVDIGRKGIPEEWILHSRTKKFARYRSQEVIALLAERDQRDELLQREANSAYNVFLQEITDKCYPILREAVNKLAVADCLVSLARVAQQNNYVKPEFADEDVLIIEEGRHPIIEAANSSPFIANTIRMGDMYPKSKIITGPNMGGKSSCVRMVALIVLMAQIGSYVPAASVKMGMVDSILTRMGASDDIAKGRSTFMVEMSETSEILHGATSKSLVILDELGRGTSTFDGMAIADATLRYLVDTIQCKTLFITHYPMVAVELEREYPLKIQNLHMSYESFARLDGVKVITFLYKLISGFPSESFGIECGRLANVPEDILVQASRRADEMREVIAIRQRRNILIKATKALQQCLSSRPEVPTSAIQALREITPFLAQSTLSSS